MGVGKYTPNLAVQGDMGWRPPFVKQWSNVFRHWSRLCKMNFNRLNRKVIKWSNLYGFKRIKNWCFRECNQFQSIGFNEYLNIDIYPSKSIINMIEGVLFENFKHD